MINEKHPYHFLRTLFTKERSTFYFSKYIYQTDSLFDERTIITATGGELSEYWIEKQFLELQAGQELAMHSVVNVGNRKLHIPMIDFAIDDTLLNSEVFNRLQNFLPKRVFLNLSVFNSGRSLHAYSTELLSPKEWREFMGRLLLINKRGAPDVIDGRWVGHRLIGGFSSLRWSNSSGKYLKIPERVAFP